MFYKLVILKFWIEVNKKYFLFSLISIKLFSIKIFQRFKYIMINNNLKDWAKKSYFIKSYTCF